MGDSPEGLADRPSEETGKTEKSEKGEAIMLKAYWVYSENVDEAGTVVEASDPEDALKEALKLWDPQDGVVWANELGELTCLGRVTKHEIDALPTKIQHMGKKKRQLYHR